MSIHPYFTVSIHCDTYNHAPYIEDTMNGFAMQQTTFPFIAVIIDDASTDDTPQVINNYLDRHFQLHDDNHTINEETDDYALTFARHNTNHNCFFAVLLLKYNHYQISKSKNRYYNRWEQNIKYIAFCEGDDYWTYPQKLQKQYEALETHPTCTISNNRVQVVEKDGITQAWGTIPAKETFAEDGIHSLEDYCREEYYNGHWCFQTSSFFIRKEMLDVYHEWCDKLWSNFPFGDMPILLTCLLNGETFFLSQTMGCYRWLSGGYISNVRSNPQKWINDNKKLQKSLIDFDNYTKKKYHTYIKKRISAIDAGIAYHYQTYSPHLLLLPRYWTLPISLKHILKLILMKLISKKR